LAILLAIAAGFVQSLALAAPADARRCHLHRRTIVTVNEFQPQVEALAVRGGRISPPGIATR